MTTSRYFSEAEFRRCTPACSLQDMEQRFIDMLDMAREYAGVPFVLTSACRTVAWEIRQGRKGTSSHTKGCAADIRYSDTRNCYLIVTALLKAGFTRIGIGASFIHADCDAEKPQQVLFNYY